MKNAGRFILLEGIDGVGKTTLCQALASRLAARGESVVLHREPTTGKHGQVIRAFLRGEIQLSPLEQWEVFQADRRESVSQVILPSLADGKTLLQDRYFYSTAAYQGGKGKSVGEILEASQEFPKPDWLFFLQLSPEAALQRRKGRGGEAEYFDDLEEQRNILKRYLDCLPPSTIFLEASQEPETLLDTVLNYL